MATMGTVVEEVDVVVRPRSVISWGSIWAGALTALAALVLLSVAALAAGLELAPVRGDVDPLFGTTVASIITGLFIVISFGAGGLTAVWAAGLVDPGPAILHGFLVFAVSLIVLLVLASIGAGSAFGGLAGVFGSGFDPVDVAALERAGWAAVLGLALAAGSAILGGLLATREEISRVW